MRSAYKAISKPPQVGIEKDIRSYQQSAVEHKIQR
jgi:hypothetical protein